MNVFISWSGNRSKAVAEILRDWIKCVLQATKPWVSTRDIDRGSLWFSEINDQLKDTTVGIICLTQENKNRPWILFEAGALAKGLTSSRVCTLLVDLKPADLEDPLAQFNHTFPDRESIWSLVRTLNTCLGSASLDERILDQVFCTYWGQFEEKFKRAIEHNPPTEIVEPRSEQTILAEILENTRMLHQKVRNLELRDAPDIVQQELESAPFRVKIPIRGGGTAFAVEKQIKSLLDENISPQSVLAIMGKLGAPVSLTEKIISLYIKDHPDFYKKADSPVT